MIGSMRTFMISLLIMLCICKVFFHIQKIMNYWIHLIPDIKLNLTSVANYSLNLVVSFDNLAYVCKN